MAGKTRRQAVALWAYLTCGDLTSDDPEPIVDLGEPIPLDRVRAAIKLFAEVGSRQATRPYLEELELLGLATWIKGDQGPKDPGFLVLEDPDGPIPYLRPPSVVGGEQRPVWTLEDPAPDLSRDVYESSAPEAPA